MTQRKRRTRLELELLEARELLHARLVIGGHAINDQDLSRFLLQKENNTPVSDRRIDYTTLQGTHVIVTLYGLGSLQGTEVNADRSLKLVYSGTTAGSGIVARVSGGNHQANLESIGPAHTSLQDLSGTRSDPVGPVNFKDFNLVDGGKINLTGGVGKLFLRSMGQNAQIHLKQLPVTTTTSSSSSTGQSASTGIGSTSSAVSSPTMLGTPNGVMVVVNHVQGGQSQSNQVLGNAQIFAYDPQAKALVQFDAVDGSVHKTIPVPKMTDQVAGVSLGRDSSGNLVVLVSDGTTVFAFNAVSGQAVPNPFTTTNLDGFTEVDGLGSTGTATVLINSLGGTHGQAQLINLGLSLNSGAAVVPSGHEAFQPDREIDLTGGATGLAGSQTIYATVAAHFDPLQPDRTQLGIMTLSTTGGTLQETNVAEITSPAAIDIGATGEARALHDAALGSIDQQLALLDPATNVITLYNPKTLAVTGTLKLDYPHQLQGLSESFHPELAGEALIDVQGSLSSFRAVDTHNLVINDAGTLGYVQIAQASNTAIVGDPVNHVNIPVRQNVQILSTSRVDSTTNTSIGDRGGVTVEPNLKPLGPLTLP